MNKCDRCGKEIKGKEYKLETFALCEHCFKAAKHELGYEWWESE